MKRTRWPVVLILLAAVVGLVVWFPGRSEVAPSRVLRSPVPASVGVEGGSWYCAARDVAAEAPEHTVIVAAVGDDEVKLRLDGFGEEGPAGTSELTVEPATTVELDVASTLGSATSSVMIEADAPVTVEHRFSSAGGADQAPCSTFSSDTWYFPTVVTTRDATARLSLFNPFPGDASVDIEVAFDTGVRQPTALSGLVVPAGTTRVVELGEQVQRREQFSATVRTRSGGVIAELAQSFDGSGDVAVTGLRLVPGTRVAAPRWSFAGGFTDPGAAERLVVMNPGEDPVDILVQVVPFGGTDVLPEPFEMKVPGLRYGVIDLGDESRVPQVGFHAIEVESVDGSPVVAARSLDITGEGDGGETNPLRAPLTSGTTASPGAGAGARSWVSAGMALTDSMNGAVMVHNSSADTATVSVTAVSAEGTEGDPVEYEIPVGDSVAVTAAELSDEEATFSVLVRSDSPVVVERLLVFLDPVDLSLQASVPVLESLDGLVDLGG